DAALGLRDVTLTTGSEVVTKTAAFTVAPGTPVLIAMNPTSGQQGQTLDVAVTGSEERRVGGTTGANGGAGVTVNGGVVHRPETATMSVSIAVDAALGLRDVTLTTGTDVVTKAAAFTVAPGTPVLIAISPTSGQQGQTLDVAVT